MDTSGGVGCSTICRPPDKTSNLGALNSMFDDVDVGFDNDDDKVPVDYVDDDGKVDDDCFCSVHLDGNTHTHTNTNSN